MCQRSLHCFEIRPGRPAAIEDHLRAPCSLTSSMSFASSAAVHEPFTWRLIRPVVGVGAQPVVVLVVVLVVAAPVVVVVVVLVLGATAELGARADAIARCRGEFWLLRSFRVCCL